MKMNMNMKMNMKMKMKMKSLPGSPRSSRPTEHNILYFDNEARQT